MDDVVRHHLVSQFLFREARLLDERRFNDWLALWTSDATYIMPTAWSDDVTGQRWADADEVHHLRLDRPMLNLRVAKLTSGSAWAEVPASRTVRSVANIEVRDIDAGEDVGESAAPGRSADLSDRAGGRALCVDSTVVVHRVRYTDDNEVHAARRLDLLVGEEGRWHLARRRVRLAHGRLLAGDLELFL